VSLRSFSWICGGSSVEDVSVRRTSVDAPGLGVHDGRLHLSPPDLGFDLILGRFPERLSYLLMSTLHTTWIFLVVG
jgi:hypothetical protein